MPGSIAFRQRCIVRSEGSEVTLEDRWQIETVHAGSRDRPVRRECNRLFTHGPRRPTVAAGALDHDNTLTYALTLTATDADGGAATTTVTVLVTEVAEGGSWRTGLAFLAWTKYRREWRARSGRPGKDVGRGGVWRAETGEAGGRCGWARRDGWVPGSSCGAMGAGLAAAATAACPEPERHGGASHGQRSGTWWRVAPSLEQQIVLSTTIVRATLQSATAAGGDAAR